MEPLCADAKEYRLVVLRPQVAQAEFLGEWRVQLQLDAQILSITGRLSRHSGMPRNILPPARAGASKTATLKPITARSCVHKTGWPGADHRPLFTPCDIRPASAQHGQVRRRFIARLCRDLDQLVLSVRCQRADGAVEAVGRTITQAITMTMPPRLALFHQLNGPQLRPSAGAHRS